MGKTNKKVLRRRKIHWKIRSRISGTVQRPRLCIFRSNKEIYAVLVDDVAGHTLASASSKGMSGGTKVDLAKKVGQAIGEAGKAAGFDKVVFDRSGYLYHGRVKALAEGAREGGLQF